MVTGLYLCIAFVVHQVQWDVECCSVSQIVCSRVDVYSTLQNVQQLYMP